MSEQTGSLLVGEFRRVYDDRYRIALPPEIVDYLGSDTAPCVLAKEQTGCLSLWRADVWTERFEVGVRVLEDKLRLGKYQGQQFSQLQQLSRMISTRSREVALGQRGRLLIPEGYREFLRAEPGGEVLVVGAGVCAEIWNIAAFNEFFTSHIGSFHGLYHELV